MKTFKTEQLEIIKNLGDVLSFSYDLQLINRSAHSKPKTLVKSAEDFYAWQLQEIAETVMQKSAKIVFIAGPSSAGKTTSSLKLKASLKRLGITAHVISMDDFFVNKVDTPLLADGSYDFENVTAVDIPYFKQFLKDVLSGKTANLPHYDFLKGERTTITPLTLKPNDKLIIEGLHALNPLFQEGLPKKSFFKVFVTVSSNFTQGDNVVITPKNLRFMRRLLRDYYKRGTKVSQTVELWHKVCQGENKYILPFRDNADYILNTTHLYEPLLYDKYLRPVLETSRLEEIQEIKNIFQKTGSIDIIYVPKNSLLREFLP